MVKSILVHNIHGLMSYDIVVRDPLNSM